MSNLYLTADLIGTPSGGGTVTENEAIALSSLGPCKVVDRAALSPLHNGPDPWCWDNCAVSQTQSAYWSGGLSHNYRLAHVYAGTFTKTVNLLKEKGCKVTYTAAAHDIDISRAAHLELGLPYNYPHLTDPLQRAQYLGGYLSSDALICPSTHSAGVMRGFGYKGPIHIIPHGCEIPEESKPLPATFTVGYMGATGPDKWLVGLMQAWAKLAYPDAALVMAGSGSTSQFVQSLVQYFSAKNVTLKGWVDDPSDFYNNVSLVIQPSRSEGFGLEVLESMAHSRPVICGTGVGASDLVRSNPGCGLIFESGNVDDLCDKINQAKKSHDLEQMGRIGRKAAEQYTWGKIRGRYIKVWKDLLG